MNSREIYKKVENRPKIKNFKNNLEVIPSKQAQCYLYGKVSKTMVNTNKPLGVLIYVFEYSYEFILGTINVLKMDSIYSQNGHNFIVSPIFNSCVGFRILKSKSPLTVVRSMLRRKFTQWSPPKILMRFRWAYKIFSGLFFIGSFSGSEPEILRFVDATKLMPLRKTSSPNQVSFFMNSSSRKGGLDF